MSISSLASNAEEPVDARDDNNTIATTEEDFRPAARVLPSTELRHTYSKSHSATQTFIAQLHTGPAALQADQPLYVNVESKKRVGISLLLTLPPLSQDSVLLLTAYCLPAFVLEEDALHGVEREQRPGVDFLPLSFSLRPQSSIGSQGSAHSRQPRTAWEPLSSSGVICRPLLSNGLYTLAL
ncbi:hypothetical protein EON64_14530, partial [archaeon]